MTLNDLIEVWWTIGEINVTARNYKGEYLKRFVFGENILASRHMEHDIDEGRLRLVDRKINFHGESKKNGPVMEWGVDERRIPPDIRDAEIMHMDAYKTSGNWTHLSVDVYMAPLRVEMADRWIDRKEEELRCFIKN